MVIKSFCSRVTVNVYCRKPSHAPTLGKGGKAFRAGMVRIAPEAARNTATPYDPIRQLSCQSGLALCDPVG